MDPVDAFAELMGRDDDEIVLDRATLLFAATEYPDLDVEAGCATLDRFAELARPRLGGASDPDAIVNLVTGLIHGYLGFAGNPDAYYDPRNSYLNQVLERRLGIPITLSVVYLEIGRRLGLPFEGVGMPGHFLVRLRHPVSPVLLDPFAGGTLVTEAACEARLQALYGPGARLDPAMLAPVSARTIIFRMLTNLKMIYANQGDWPRVVRTIDLLLITRPGASVEYRDRGAAHLRTGNLRRARADFEHYLLNAAEVDDATSIREQLSLVDRLESMRN